MTVPAWFLQALRDTDPRLVCYFNPFLRCFVIDRKAEDGQTSNVLVCKSDTGEALPLNENLIDRVRSMDAWKTFGTYEAYQRDRLQREIDGARAINKQIEDNYREASLDNKIQLRKAFDLVQRHDMRVNQ